MKFSRADADIYVPAGTDTPETALGRVTHLAVGAHQDDLEIMAYSGICDCLEGEGLAFGGVVVTNGAGSSRSGPYASCSDGEMQAVRRAEQRRAAQIGQYAIQIQLAHPSSDVKQARHSGVAGDLQAIFASCRPAVVYLHQPADKHDTHVAVLLRCLAALRGLPPEERPRRVLGCEVWRDLDWLPDEAKVALDTGRRPELARALLTVFDSQISGGKRYDLAALGRRAANATYHQPHASDAFAGITWAMDLTPLVTEPAADLRTYVADHLERLRVDVLGRLARLS